MCQCWLCRIFSQSFGSFTGESLYVCEFLFLPCRGLAASSGLGSLPQCAAIVWLCGSPLPIAKLFRRAPSPFSFFLVPARLRALVSLISIVFISHRIFSSCSRLSPGTRHLFCIVHVFTRFCVFILSVALLPRVFSTSHPCFPPIRAIRSYSFGLLFSLNQTNSRTHSWLCEYTSLPEQGSMKICKPTHAYNVDWYVCVLGPPSIWRLS